jgi:hypothetical protein
VTQPHLLPAAPVRRQPAAIGVPYASGIAHPHRAARAAGLGGAANARQGVTAMDTGKVPTAIGLPATLVAVAIGVTVSDEPLTT